MAFSVNKAKIAVGDYVKVLVGTDRGKVGKVMRIFAGDGDDLRVVVEGCFMRKKHVKGNENQSGHISSQEGSISYSNVAYYDKNNSCVTKLGRKNDGSVLKRFAKKSGVFI